MITAEKCNTERFDAIYKALEKSMGNIQLYERISVPVEKHADIAAVHMFLLGAIHALRMFCDYEVPEIELAFKQAEKFMPKEGIECLLTLFEQQQNSTL